LPTAYGLCLMAKILYKLKTGIPKERLNLS
jgi:hypothetical protein